MNNNETIELQSILNLLTYFQSDSNVRMLHRIFKRKSITDIYGVARKELQHSNFLAWLLDPYESHGLGAYALERFLLLVARRGMFQKNNDKGFSSVKNDLLLLQLNVSNVSIVTEYNVNGGRIDILVENIQIGDKTVNLIIENKVDSKEHDGQTSTYYNEINKRFHNSRIFIYSLHQNHQKF